MEKLSALVKLAEQRVEQMTKRFSAVKLELEAKHSALENAEQIEVQIRSDVAREKMQMRSAMVEKPSNAFLLERYRYSNDRMNRTIAAAESMIQTKKTEIEEKQVEVASVRERLFKAQKLLDKRKKLQKDFELQREQELELAEELELEDLAFQKIDMGNSQ